MSQNENTPPITQPAQVDNAQIFWSDILLNPSLLEVKAQPSGFNWNVHIVVGDEIEPIELEYLPYYVVETRTGPGWPSNAGIGPVVLPVDVRQPIYRTGPKGIVVVGADGYRKQFDVQAAKAA
jgi:hypothetical protein